MCNTLLNLVAKQHSNHACHVDLHVPTRLSTECTQQLQYYFRKQYTTAIIPAVIRSRPCTTLKVLGADFLITSLRVHVVVQQPVLLATLRTQVPGSQLYSCAYLASSLMGTCMGMAPSANHSYLSTTKFSTAVYSCSIVSSTALAQYMQLYYSCSTRVRPY